MREMRGDKVSDWNIEISWIFSKHEEEHLKAKLRLRMFATNKTDGRECACVCDMLINK